jgi:hypothetical protein
LFGFYETEFDPLLGLEFSNVLGNALRGERGLGRRLSRLTPKSFAQLGMEAHWLVDGIDREGYQIVVHTVPAVPRFILLHGFARAYRRRARARWQPGIPVQRAGAC